MPPQLRDSEIARGPGPRWLRITLAVVAGIYLAALIKHPSSSGSLGSVAFFTEATKLFPEADNVALEYRLDAWSCEAHAWLPLDPRPYFPIEADDKESRFQRLGYFYGDRAGGETRRTVMNALDDYILAHHESVDDGVAGKIGGIKFFKVSRPLPAVGDEVPRYVYRPLAAPPPEAKLTELFHTRASIRKARCGAAVPAEPE
ncbi:MAG: hypothetical protein ACM31C_33975 [Acidobacteriota bacterium]